jgi:hypothetical protein
MQVMLNIPDVIPQEIVNRILKQVESQLQVEEKLASQSSAVMTKTPPSAEMMDQLKIGREFMQEYHETFNALAK